MSRTGRSLIGLLAVVLLLFIVAWLATPLAIERIVTSELNERGLATADIDVGMLGPTGTTVRRVRLGGDEAFTADALVVEYSLPGLIKRRIDRIRLVRPRLRLAISDTGEVSFGSLDPLLRSPSSDGRAAQLGLPAPLEILDGAVTASTPTGEITARLDGAVTLEAGAGPLRIALDGPWLSAVAELRMKQEGSSFSVSGRLIDGRIAHALLSGSFAGPFTATLDSETPAASAELALSDLRSPVLAIGTTAAAGDLSAWYERGRIAGDLRLAAPGGRLELSLLGDTPQSFRVAYSGDGLGVAETISDARLEGSFDVDSSARAATLAETATLQGQLAPKWIEALPAALRPALAEGPLSLTADPGLAIAYGSSGLSASGRLTIAKPESWELVVDGSVSPQSETTAAMVQLQLSAPAVSLAGYGLKKLSLKAPIAAKFGANGTEIRLAGAAPLTIGTLDKGTFRIAGLTVPLQPHEQPLFASGTAGSAFALRAAAVKAEGRFGKDREPFTLAWKDATVQGRPGAMMAATISGGRIALPRLGWEADGVSARLQADEANSAPPAVELDIARLAETVKQPRLAPLGVKGTLYPTDTALRFDLRGAAADGQAQLSIKGSHDLTRGRGSASLRVEPLRFIPGKLQPAALVPALGDAVRDATGTLSGGGKIGWSDKGLMSDLEFSLDRVGFLGPAGPVLGVNGTVRLDGLAPLSTPPGQRITIAAVQAAVPVSDVRLQFGLREGRFLDIEEAKLLLAGGRVSVAPASLDAEADRNELTLEIAEIQLPVLFDLIGLDGLTGTGRLGGEVPVAWERGDFAVEGGELESQEPGQIRYDPAAPPSALQGGGEMVGLALAALKNFHYDRLTLNLDREIGGETLVGLHIAGKNPDFYGGYPVEFNLNLSGKLDQILMQGLAGYRASETIQDQLKQPPAGSSPSPP